MIAPLRTVIQSSSVLGVVVWIPLASTVVATEFQTRSPAGSTMCCMISLIEAVVVYGGCGDAGAFEAAVASDLDPWHAARVAPSKTTRKNMRRRGIMLVMSNPDNTAGNSELCMNSCSDLLSPA